MSDEQASPEPKPRPLSKAKVVAPAKAAAPVKTAAPAKVSPPAKPQEKAPTLPAPKKRRLSTWAKVKWLFVLLLLLSYVGYRVVRDCGEWGGKQLVTEYVALDDENLSPAGPLRIAFVADTHNNPTMMQWAVAIIKYHQPDIIFFGGDLLNAQDRFRRTRWIIQVFKDMAEIAPTYAVLGNHDTERLADVERVFKKANIPILRNEAITWTTPAGKQVRIIGLGDWNEYDEDPEACMKAVGEEELPVILLSHDPESRWLLRQYDWDLMLAGHTHGGQLGDPRTGELISFRSSMPGGLYDFEGNRKVYVTRGVGAFMNMRFFCPPEVTIIDIKPSPQSGE